MRRRRLPHPALAAGAALALSACGAGDPTYYKLSTWPGSPLAGGPAAMEVGTPTIASFLDRDYIVSKTENYQLQLAGNRAWAEPLGDMIGRVFAADLAQRLPATGVYPQGSAVASRDPTARADLDVTRFDKDQDGQAVLEATLAVRATAAHAPATQLVPIRLAETPTGPGTGELVATLSRELGEVADRAAALALRLPPPPPDPYDDADGR